jgi:hypothetical protein
MGVDCALFCRSRKDPKQIDILLMGRLYYFEGLTFTTGEEGWTDNIKKARRDIAERIAYVQSEEWAEEADQDRVPEWRERYLYALKHLKVQLERGWKKWSEVVITGDLSELYDEIRTFGPENGYTLTMLEDIVVEEDFLDDI